MAEFQPISGQSWYFVIDPRKQLDTHIDNIPFDGLWYTNDGYKQFVVWNPDLGRDEEPRTMIGTRYDGDDMDLMAFEQFVINTFVPDELEPAPSPEQEQDELPNCEACGNTRQMRASAPMVGEMLTPCPFCVPVNAAGDTTEVMWLRAEYHRLIAERDALRKALQPFAALGEAFPGNDASEIAWGVKSGSISSELECVLTWGDFRKAADALGE